jgi:phage-related protein
MGDDRHGYCRTFGSGVPHSLVYQKESNSSQSTADLIKEITEHVRQEFQTQLDQLQARIDFMQNKDSATEPSRQVEQKNY